MKTKKSGVRGSVITNADLEKSIKELDGVASGRVKLFGRYDFYEPLAGDGPLARALVPFNKAAAGAALKADDKTLEKFWAMWFGVCQSFDPGPDLRMSFGLVWNGFINAGSVWMCPQVFGGDYGVFRFNLSKAVQWKFYEQCGAQKDCERITKIEDGQKWRDIKIREAVLAAKGEKTKIETRAWQTIKAAKLFQATFRKEEGKKATTVCLACCRNVLKKDEYRKFEDGREVDMSLGYDEGCIYTFQKNVLRMLGRI